MSHVAKIEMQIKSLETLKAACQRMGLTFLEGQKSYKWYGHHVGDYPLPQGFSVNDMGKCDHAIHVPGASYEVGVVQSRTNPGNWELLWDFWSSGGLQKQLGKDGGLLKQAYAIEQTKAVASLEGHYCNEIKQDDGTVHLQIMM